MRILLLVSALAIAGCFPDPDPGCPEGCEEVLGVDEYVEGCLCPPGFFEEFCGERECPEPTEEDCEDAGWR